MKKLRLLMLTILLSSFSTGHAAIKEYITTNEVLKWGQKLQSLDRNFYATLQNDGNFVIYKGSGENERFGVAWHSDSSGPAGDYFLILQSDGNIVIYKGTGPRDNKGYHWSTRITNGSGKHFLKMQTDGTLAAYEGTPASQGRYYWGTGDPVRVTWLIDGRFIHLERMTLKSGAIFWGHLDKNSKEDLHIWMDFDWPRLAERWKLLSDGTIRRASDSSKCLTFRQYDLDVMMPRYGAEQAKVVLSSCNGSELHTGWSYDLSDNTIRHRKWQQGCALGVQNWGSGWWSMYFHSTLCAAHASDWHDRARFRFILTEEL